MDFDNQEEQRREVLENIAESCGMSVIGWNYTINRPECIGTDEQWSKYESEVAKTPF